MADIAAPTGAIKLKLKSKEGAIFEVDKAVATQINFVKGMLEGMYAPLTLQREHCARKSQRKCGYAWPRTHANPRLQKLTQDRTCDTWRDRRG